MNKEKKISFRVSEIQYNSLIDMANKANMTLSGYIKYALLDNTNVQIIDKSAEIISQVCNIETAINKLNTVYQEVDFTELQKESKELWHIVSLS